jgi:hypothetical protein
MDDSPMVKEPILVVVVALSPTMHEIVDVHRMKMLVDVWAIPRPSTTFQHPPFRYRKKWLV